MEGAALKAPESSTSGYRCLNYADPFGLCPKSGGGDGKTTEYSDCPDGTSGYYAHRIATGEGNYSWNNARGIAATCAETAACRNLGKAGAAFAAHASGLRVAFNRSVGKAFEGVVAEGLGAAGRVVETNVYFNTPYGRRFADLLVRDGNLNPLGLIEVKAGSSPYTAMQQLKDAWIREVTGLRTDLVRQYQP